MVSRMDGDGHARGSVLERDGGAPAPRDHAAEEAEQEVREDPGASRARLIALLQLAFSGELAAAHAYRGHARSVADAGERRAIEEIEREELHHRELVGRMLAELGAGPSRTRELRAAMV